MNRRVALREMALGLLCLSAVWPLVEISHPRDVALPLAATALAIWLVGAVLRARRTRSPFIVGAQALALVLSMLGALLAHGVSPSISGVQDAITQGLDDANGSVAPLPAHAGVLAILAGGAALVALVVDFVGGTSRLPALTVLPVAAPFVLATTAVGETLPLGYFALAAAAWALLMWAETSRAPHLMRVAPAFVVVTAGAVAAAVLVAPHVPARQTPALAQNGARGMNMTVDFNESLDLSKDLSSRNAAPVLTYTTEDPSPGPLRVTTSSTYRDGTWKAQSPSATVPLKANTEFPSAGYDASVPATTYKATVTLNGMRPPLVASPTTLRAANFGADNATFTVGRTDGVPRLNKPAQAYSVLFRTLTGAARPTNDESVKAGGSVLASDLDTSGMTTDAAAREQALLAASGAKDAGSRFDAAVKVQNYLRSDPSFTYSLRLAPTQTIDGRRLDPLANFLATRRGYCTQFATAMVMAARTQGIPARVAIGFLPGTLHGSEYTVRAGDAHAWAELYFPGMGWTRFEPTPGQRAGAAPAYTRESNPTASTSSTSAPTRSTSVAPRTSSAAPTSRTSTSSSSSRPAHPHPHSGLDWTLILSVLGGVVAVGAALSVLPLRGWFRRNGLLRRSTNDRGRDEGEWHRMVWNLRDLGYTVPGGRSPRDSAERFVDDNPSSSPQLREALTRAASAIETSRYAPNPTRSVASATGRVTRTARQDASLTTRLGAWLAPKSGRTRRHDS